MDQYFIGEALKLAKKGLSWTWPNPMVGAVIVKNGKIIGTGYHHKVGEPHAEIGAIVSAKKDLKGATLYVNLEPCSHYGKTPPCVETIIASGIKRVVCSTPDPNPKVAGKGIKKLKQAGIEVVVGILEKEARKLNEAFFTFHTKKRLFVAIKFAASLDGKIATYTGDSKWISNEKSRQFAVSLRANYQSILVGVNTVIADNPHLGVRKLGKKDPVRIILDSRLRVPVDAQVFRDNNVIVATTQKADKKKKGVLKNKGITVVDCGLSEVSLQKLLSELALRKIISILVEGGGKIIGSFIDEKLVDKIYACHSPIIIGGVKAVSAVEGKGFDTIREALRLKEVTHKKFGDTLLTVGYV